MYVCMYEYFELKRKFNLVNIILDPVFVVTIRLLKAVLGPR